MKRLLDGDEVHATVVRGAGPEVARTAGHVVADDPGPLEVPGRPLREGGAHDHHHRPSRGGRGGAGGWAEGNRGGGRVQDRRAGEGADLAGEGPLPRSTEDEDLEAEDVPEMPGHGRKAVRIPQLARSVLRSGVDGHEPPAG